MRRILSAQPLTKQSPPSAASDLLIVLADFRMRAQHRVQRFEHVAHASRGDRAFHNHDKLRLVRGGPDEAPGTVCEGHAYAIDRDQIADLLSGYFLAGLPRPL